ncbi:MAG: acyltransferase [Planctomycetes bacterium]|nr:acyltransferase [Planctomycetota bacterium]MCC7397277.1 acyltransferase [Planctomycetota bacterium]
MTRSAEPARLDALDGVRGLAILSVFVMHAALYVPLLPIGDIPLAEGYMRLALLGWCGVDVFFVLSGFLITGILVRTKGSPHYFRNFYARRSLRIFPLYYVVILLLLFVLASKPLAEGEALAHLAYYQNLWYAFSGHGAADVSRSVTWSLAIEEQFYLLWPALVLLVSRRGLVIACVAVALGAIVARLLSLDAGLVQTHFVTWCRLDALAMGSLLALLPLPPRWLGLLLALAGAAGLVLLMSTTGASLPEALPMQQYGLPAALALATGVLVLARHPGPFAALCRLRPLRSLGRYSYCVYLIHVLAIQFVVERVGVHRTSAEFAAVLRQWPTLLLIVAFTSLSLVLAWGLGWLSWHLFEKRVLVLKDRFPNGG